MSETTTLRERLAKLTKQRPSGLCDLGCEGRCQLCPADWADELLKLAADALARAAGAPQTWQPMETAPKDETRILVRLAEARYVRWRWNGDDREDGGYWAVVGDTMHTEDVNADGWLLPPPVVVARPEK